MIVDPDRIRGTFTEWKFWINGDEYTLVEYTRDLSIELCKNHGPSGDGEHFVALEITTAEIVAKLAEWGVEFRNGDGREVSPGRE
jgi:hypothetical protein